MAEHRTTLVFDARTTGFQKAAEDAKRLQKAIAPSGQHRLQGVLSQRDESRASKTGIHGSATAIAKAMHAAERSMAKMEAISEKMVSNFERIRGITEGPATGGLGGGGGSGRGLGVGGAVAALGISGILRSPMGLGVQTALWAGRKAFASTMGPGLAAGEAALARDRTRLGFAPFLSTSDVSVSPDLVTGATRKMDRDRQRFLEDSGAPSLKAHAIEWQQFINRQQKAGNLSAWERDRDKAWSQTASIRDETIRTAQAAARFAAARNISREFGLDEQQGLGAYSELLGRAGGRQGAASDRLFSSALGAQTAYGVSLSAAGTFGAMARNQAVTGGSSGAEILSEAVSRGLSMGFGGAELGRFISRFESVMQEFMQTGVPIDIRGSMAVAEQLTGLGINRSRATSITEGLRTNMAAMAKRGPQGMLDAQALMALGGFKGGSMEDYFSALQGMESGDWMRDPKRLAAFIRRGSNLFGGGTKSKQESLRRTMRARGVEISPEEAQSLIGSAQSGDLAAIKSIIERKAMTPDDLAQAGRGMVGRLAPGARRQASIADETADAGEPLRNFTLTIKTLEVTMAKAVSGFASQLDSVSTMLAQLEQAFLDALGSQSGSGR